MSGNMPSSIIAGMRCSAVASGSSGDNRKAGRFVHVEVRPGVVMVVAAWMLDASACVGMEIGAPRASLAALRISTTF